MPSAKGLARDLLRVRKERVHSTMLIEVLALFIFMSMAFAFVLRDEAVATNPLARKVQKLEREMAALHRENAALKLQVGQLTSANKQLLQAVTNKTIGPNDTVIITKSQWQELIDRLANTQAVLDAKTVENAGLRARLTGRGGSDLPNCNVSPEPFIASIELYEDGLRVSPRWKAAATQAAVQVPGLMALTRGRTLSLSDFRSLSQGIKAWGRKQPQPCAFRVVVYPKHSSMDLYRRQQAVIGDAFYPSYR